MKNIRQLLRQFQDYIQKAQTQLEKTSNSILTLQQAIHRPKSILHIPLKYFQNVLMEQSTLQKDMLQFKNKFQLVKDILQYYHQQRLFNEIQNLKQIAIRIQNRIKPYSITQQELYNELQYQKDEIKQDQISQLNNINRIIQIPNRDRQIWEEDIFCQGQIPRAQDQLLQFEIKIQSKDKLNQNKVQKWKQNNDKGEAQNEYSQNRISYYNKFKQNAKNLEKQAKNQLIYQNNSSNKQKPNQKQIKQKISKQENIQSQQCKLQQQRNSIFFSNYRQQNKKKLRQNQNSGQINVFNKQEKNQSMREIIGKQQKQTIENKKQQKFLINKNQPQQKSLNSEQKNDRCIQNQMIKKFQKKQSIQSPIHLIEKQQKMLNTISTQSSFYSLNKTKQHINPQSKQFKKQCIKKDDVKIQQI